MGKDSHKEMLFWTKDEYLKFAKVVMDKPTSYDQQQNQHHRRARPAL